MTYYLILCRSLTYAQRTASLLERAGISAHILRTPKQISLHGCGHSVKISQRNLNAALSVLHRSGAGTPEIYLTEGDGSYREVAL